MNKNYSCDIIKDLLPGYIDGILSEAGKNIVKEHLEECEACNKIYLEMKEELNTGMDAKEHAALDGFKKLRQHTRKLKITVGIVISLLIFLLLSAFVKVFVIGIPLPTHAISIDELSYNETTNCLEISGTVNFASCRVSRVTWKQSEKNSNAVNVFVYGTETLPFQSDNRVFNISIPSMKGKTVYLACPDFDQQEVYNWKHYHNEKMTELENEIYSRLTELDRTKDALSYNDGIETVNGTEGICYSVHSVIGENAAFWTFNDQLITDGDFESRDFEIWISLDKPYQILIHDYQSGEYTDDYSIINRR